MSCVTVGALLSQENPPNVARPPLLGTPPDQFDALLQLPPPSTDQLPLVCARVECSAGATSAATAAISSAARRRTLGGGGGVRSNSIPSLPRPKQRQHRTCASATI